MEEYNWTSQKCDCSKPIKLNRSSKVHKANFSTAPTSVYMGKSNIAKFEEWWSDKYIKEAKLESIEKKINCLHDLLK